MNSIPVCLIRRRGVAALAAFSFYALSIVCVHSGEARTPPKRILCTTFPMYQLTRNVVEGSGVSVDLMIPAALGCPHDYALTPLDMEKIAAADILVVNGQGLEEFMGKPVERANPDIAVIDSSLGLRGAMAPKDGGHRHDDDPDPHLFASPALSARLAETIAGGLCALDPAGAELYAANAAAYAGRLRGLAGEMAEAAKGFAGRRIVETHGTFDYLARDLGLEIVARLQPHGQELSTARMLEILEIIRERKPAAIVVEPQYPARAGETLAAETGLPVIALDPAASGPDDAPLDHYENVMRANLAALKDVLGGK